MSEPGEPVLYAGRWYAYPLVEPPDNPEDGFRWYVVRLGEESFAFARWFQASDVRLEGDRAKPGAWLLDDGGFEERDEGRVNAWLWVPTPP